MSAYRHRLSGLSKAFAAIALLALSACATGPAPYAPKTADSNTGYSDMALTSTHYRVTYVGDSQTPRDVVEDYLLYRSGEVTLNAGYHWFIFDTRSTKAKTTYMTNFDGWPGWYGYYGWHWRGWGWDGPWGSPFPADQTTTSITRYAAYAEIVLLTDDQAKNEPRAINADQLVAHLRDKVLTQGKQSK